MHNEKGARLASHGFGGLLIGYMVFSTAFATWTAPFLCCSTCSLASDYLFIAFFCRKCARMHAVFIDRRRSKYQYKLQEPFKSKQASKACGREGSFTHH
jgi:hypothetical protein